jgi:hypothetical protein
MTISATWQRNLRLARASFLLGNWLKSHARNLILGPIRDPEQAGAHRLYNGDVLIGPRENRLRG